MMWRMKTPKVMPKHWFEQHRQANSEQDIVLTESYADGLPFRELFDIWQNTLGNKLHTITARHVHSPNVPDVLLHLSVVAYLRKWLWIQILNMYISESPLYYANHIAAKIYLLVIAAAIHLVLLCGTSCRLGEQLTKNSNVTNLKT